MPRNKSGLKLKSSNEVIAFFKLLLLLSLSVVVDVLVEVCLREDDEDEEDEDRLDELIIYGGWCVAVF